MDTDEFIKILNEACNRSRAVTFNTTDCEALKKILEEAKTAKIRLQYIEDTEPEIATESEIAAIFIQSPEMTEIAGKITRALNATVDLVSEVAEAAGNAMAHLVESQIEREEEEE